MKGFKGLVSAIFCSMLSLAGASAFAEGQQPVVAKPLDADMACGEDGQCVIFEVNIKMNTYMKSPIIRHSRGVVTIGGFNNPYGSIVRRIADKCSKQVLVPRPVFDSIVSIMKSLSGDGGPQAPAFTPAQQTTLLFYTTLMTQTLQFNCLNNGNGGGSGGSSAGGTSGAGRF